MLIVCRQGLTEEDLARLEGKLAKLPYRVRWARRAGRLALLVERARADQGDVDPVVEDTAVEYALRDPTEDEIARIFSRRDLLNVALGATGLMAAILLGAPVVAILTTPGDERSMRGDIYVGALGDLQVNRAHTHMVDGEEYLVIRRDETRFAAVAMTCTHSGVCAVEWDPKRHQLVCPCHRGVFDIYGNVVSGPPPRPLPTREVVVREDKVYVRRSAR